MSRHSFLTRIPKKWSKWDWLQPLQYTYHVLKWQYDNQCMATRRNESSHNERTIILFAVTVCTDLSNRLSTYFITDVKRRADDNSHSFPKKQLCFLVLKETHYAMQNVSLPLSPSSFMMQLDFFFSPEQTSDCVFMYFSSCLDVWAIKRMAEPPSDLVFAAFLLHIRTVVFKKLWNPPTSIPLSFSPSNTQTTRATGGWRCTVDGCRGGQEH